MHHFVERRRDQARQPDHVGFLAPCRLENVVTGHHDAQVHDFEVVALQNDADDVLADVVDVALDRRQHDLAVGTAIAVLLLLDIGNEVANGLLHHACRFHHLRQEHLAGAEQVADDIHTRHQRTLDHVERTPGGTSGLLGVVDDILIDAVHERILESLANVEFTPRQVLAARGGAALLILVLLRHLEQFLGGIGHAIEHHVFDGIA